MSLRLRAYGWQPLLLAVVLACGEGGQQQRLPTLTPAPVTTAVSTPTLTAGPTPTAAATPRLEVVVADAEFPVALAFAPDGRLFYNELRTGRIRIVDGGRLQEAPFAQMTVQATGEHGLLGLAIDPNFTVNHYIYAFLSVPAADGSPLKQQVVRFTEVNGRGTEMTVILDDLPIGAAVHNGGRLGFGPDGKLYVSIGDTQDRESAQDLGKLSGKILRYNPDGTIPDGGPLPGTPVFALGLRNPFGLAWQPETGELFASDNGSAGHDEINWIHPGGNYGWPQVMGIAGDPNLLDPLYDSGDPPAIVPTGMTFYTGDLLPFAGDLFFCSFNRNALLRVDDREIERIMASPATGAVGVIDTGLPCQLDVKVGPEGALYFSDTRNIYRWGR